MKSFVFIHIFINLMLFSSQFVPIRHCCLRGSMHGFVAESRLFSPPVELYSCAVDDDQVCFIGVLLLFFDVAVVLFFLFFSVFIKAFAFFIFHFFHSIVGMFIYFLVISQSTYDFWGVAEMIYGGSCCVYVCFVWYVLLLYKQVKTTGQKMMIF